MGILVLTGMEYHPCIEGRVLNTGPYLREVTAGDFKHSLLVYFQFEIHLAYTLCKFKMHSVNLILNILKRNDYRAVGWHLMPHKLPFFLFVLLLRIVKVYHLSNF